MHNIIVTGGSRGLGLAIVRRLARAGFAVIAVARNEGEALIDARLEAERTGTGRVTFVALDLSEIDSIPEFVRVARKNHGPFYGLVNNAGIGTEGLLAMMHNSEIETLIRVNMLSPIVMTKYVVRGMMAEGGGRIVNISSIIGSTGFNALSVYAATKASLIGFTRSLSREVGPMNVTVNAVAPGFIATDLTSAMDEDKRSQVARRSALKRLAQSEDVAAMVEFLVGDGGRNITGTVMTVDAGGTA